MTDEPWWVSAGLFHHHFTREENQATPPSDLGLSSHVCQLNKKKTWEKAASRKLRDNCYKPGRSGHSFLKIDF